MKTCLFYFTVFAFLMGCHTKKTSDANIFKATIQNFLEEERFTKNNFFVDVTPSRSDSLRSKNNKLSLGNKTNPYINTRMEIVNELTIDTLSKEFYLSCQFPSMLPPPNKKKLSDDCKPYLNTFLLEIKLSQKMPSTNPQQRTTIVILYSNHGYVKYELLLEHNIDKWKVVNRKQIEMVMS